MACVQEASFGSNPRELEWNVGKNEERKAGKATASLCWWDGHYCGQLAFNLPGASEEPGALWEIGWGATSIPELIISKTKTENVSTTSGVWLQEDKRN